MKNGFEEKNHGFETKYGFTRKKKMGVRYIMKDSHEVWICKKKMMGVRYVMKDYQEVWI